MELLPGWGEIDKKDPTLLNGSTGNINEVTGELLNPDLEMYEE